MKNVLTAIVMTLLVLVIIFTVYIYSGNFDPGQLKHHKPLTEKIIGITMEHSINKRIKGIIVPDLQDTSLFSTGISHYNEMCVVCHGGPGVDPSELAKGLYPEPPVLYKAEMPKPDEAFWIIKNGIKMTGMPGFGPTHSDNEIWAITAFMLNKMNSLSSVDYRNWIRKSPEHGM